MPYQRKRTYKKRTAARRPAVRKVVKAELYKQIETKYWDGAIETNTLSSSGLAYYLLSDPNPVTTISQGANGDNYVGNKMKPTHITIRGRLTAADSYNVCRFVVLQVKGVFVPTGSSIFQNTYALSAPLLSLNRDYNDRYRVLADRMITVDATDTSKQFKIMIPGKRLYPVSFSDANGTAENGGLYIVMVSDSSAVSHPSFGLAWRVFYKDA